MKRRGLAVLEALLTIFLLGLVLGALFNFLPVSLLTSERSGRRLQAQALADNQLEQMRALPFAQLRPSLAVKQVEIAGQRYELTSEVFLVTGHQSNRLKGLRCLVKWSDRSLKNQLENEVWVSCVGH